MIKCPICGNEITSATCSVCRYGLDDELIIKLSRLSKLNISDADKMFHLAQTCYKLEHDIDLSIKYYQEAVRLGSVEAMEILGNMYELGDNVKQDIDKAINYYQQAAKLDSIEALSHLANMYHHGKHVEKDLTKAIMYYEKLSNLHSDELICRSCIERATVAIGDIYYEQRDYLKAKQYYEKIFLKAKNMQAASKLVTMYRDGLGVSKDEIKAKEYEKQINDIYKSL